MLDRLLVEHDQLAKTLNYLEMHFMELCRGGRPDYSLMHSLLEYIHEYPEQIESIFMDNACADALSWPAGKELAGHLEYEPGKHYSGPGSEASFKMYLDAYDEFSTFPEAVEYFKTRGSPIHLLEPLAEAGVPILSICGKTDHAVPYEENDAVLEKRYQALGGDITVIVEDKGHRHGTRENKKVLLDFIRQHTGR